METGDHEVFSLTLFFHMMMFISLSSLYLSLLYIVTIYWCMLLSLKGDRKSISKLLAFNTTYEQKNRILWDTLYICI